MAWLAAAASSSRSAPGDLAIQPSALSDAATSHDLSFYHSTTSLLDRFTAMAKGTRCAQRMQVSAIHDEADPAFKLNTYTFADGYAAQRPRRPKRVLLNFGAHGTELITSEVALQLALVLCGEAPSRFYGSVERSRLRINELLADVEVMVVPVQVPASRMLAERASGTCRSRRLNLHGVDVNRNWNVTWELGDGHAGSDTYHGTAPFSEPETRALARVAEEWHPDLFADVHSGDRCAIFGRSFGGAILRRSSARNPGAPLRAIF